jgi:hypothetical protein
MDDEEETIVIGPKIPQNSQNQAQARLTSKLNHFFSLKSTKGVSLNQQLAAHPDFHAPGITETLLDFMGLDPWGSNLSEQVAKPFWDKLEAEGAFDYVKVAQDQRQIWESKNPQIMNAVTKPSNQMNTTMNTFNPREFRTNIQPRKRI